MFYLENIKVTNFKNYEEQTLDCSERLNCLVGFNGMGKTNMIDAIYYLCMCKSHLGGTDRTVLKHNERFFRLEGLFKRQARKERIVCKVIPSKLKEIERNQKRYDKLSEHIGLLPIVIIAPDDTLLITEGSEERRRFLDNTIAQSNQQYLKQLITYNKLLKQRNALLKQFAEKRTFNETLLATYDTKMLPLAKYIHDTRQQALKDILPFLTDYYTSISNEKEQVNCIYKSQLESNNLDTLFSEQREKDRILQRTTVGVHKDDLIFTINDYALKRFASQGQKKSFILALKLAQYDLLKKEKEVCPILLLDDIFDKLDKQRVQQLLALLVQNNFGQIFITDTDKNRVAHIIQELDTDYKMFNVEDGYIEAI